MINFAMLVIMEKQLLVQMILKNAMNATKRENNTIRISTMIDS
jgi:hypothetical protein